jgi:hypothetical protein
MIISLASMLAALGVWANWTYGAGPFKDVADWVALPVQAQTGVGVHLERHDIRRNPMTTLITTGEAMKISAKRISKAQAGQAVVHVTFGDFFDDTFFATRPQGSSRDVKNGVPAYVITYDGVIVPLAGLSRGTNSELIVVVEAATGEVIEEFSFR